MAKTYRLFVSPRGFSNEGKIYFFPSAKARSAAEDRANEALPEEGQGYVSPISADGARCKLEGDASTRSYVDTAEANDFEEDYGASAGQAPDRVHVAAGAFP